MASWNAFRRKKFSLLEEKIMRLEKENSTLQEKALLLTAR